MDTQFRGGGFDAGGCCPCAEMVAAATSVSVTLVDFLTPQHIAPIFTRRKHLTRVEAQVAGLPDKRQGISVWIPTVVHVISAPAGCDDFANLR